MEGGADEDASCWDGGAAVRLGGIDGSKPGLNDVGAAIGCICVVLACFVGLQSLISVSQGNSYLSTGGYLWSILVIFLP